ncbi:helix-turn-helix domain-containing protein [Burkholderia stabilis]|uniref:helix-turn-helix domain-containing protein n=1 Tax=Burkholderia stabilis TaxID=95485 RepID=UPI001F4A60E7|nr:helix-turn-helix domain-containing protein [Burkholderia stabilis]
MAMQFARTSWTRWSNIELHPSEQFDAWRDKVMTGIVTFSPVIHRTQWAQPFPCSMELDRFDDLFICHSTLSPQNLSRGPAEISRDLLDMYTIVLSFSRQQMQYGRDTYEIKSGSLYLLDNCNALTSSIIGTQTSQVTIHIPRKRLAPLLSSTNRRPLWELNNTGNGLGHIASGMIQQVFSCRDQLDNSAKEILADHLVSIIAAAAGATTDARTLGAEAIHHELYLAICRHISKHLSDHTLSAVTVAKHFRISPRYLHKLFEPSDKSFAQTVINLRLEYCVKMLAHASHHIKISEIAYRCGFGDISHFGRIFRKKYGVSPREYRNDHLATDSKSTKLSSTTPFS